MGGDTHQYYPELVQDNAQVEPPATPEEGYHLTPDLVTKAKAMIADAKQVAPNKPFFMYFATGAMHAPHHVPKEWADKYKGKFDGGWDGKFQNLACPSGYYAYQLVATDNRTKVIEKAGSVLLLK
jgi:arylsulfatase